MIADGYSQRALDFVEKVRNLCAFEDIQDSLLAELKQFGFEFVTIWSVPSVKNSFLETIVSNTRPADYIDHYDRNNLASKDPVVLELKRMLRPFSWGDLKRNRRLTRRDLSIIAEGRDFGADDGLLIPIVSQKGTIGIVSPCGKSPDLSPRARSALDMICLYSYEALQRCATQKKRQRQIDLTEREREILAWIAIGKNDDEIGEILKIASSTVTTHVENCKRKFDAGKRIYAVTQAILSGQLSMDLF